MRSRRHIAPQWELGLIEERPPERVELPPVGGLIRLSGADRGNGVFKVASAMHTPDGMFLGLAIPRVKARREPRPIVKQEDLFV